MKTIEAVWEKRNLGVDTVEFEIEPGDSFAEFRERERTAAATHAYLVAKCPPALPDFIWGLPACGFVQVEIQFRLTLDRSELAEPPQARYLDRGAEVVRLEAPADRQRVRVEFEQGMFDTDRIALDPRFGAGVAGARYWLWTEDILRRGGCLHELRLGKRAVGCFVSEPRDAVTCGAVLGGVYPALRGRGLGFLVVRKHLDTIFGMGFQRSVTAVSSNNADILPISLAFGYRITEMRGVYVKHAA
jgi:hypothetical protein